MQGPVSGTLLKSSNGERGTDEKPRVLGDNGGQCDAVDCHAEPNDKQQVENNIRDVDRQEYIEWNARVLQADKPAD